MVFQSYSIQLILVLLEDRPGYWRLMKEWTAKDHCRDFIGPAPFFVEEKTAGTILFGGKTKKTATQETKKMRHFVAKRSCQKIYNVYFYPFLVSHSYSTLIDGVARYFLDYNFSGKARTRKFHRVWFLTTT